MIARAWRGATRSADGDAYLEYLKRTGLREYRATPVTAGWRPPSYWTVKKTVSTTQGMRGMWSQSPTTAMRRWSPGGTSSKV